VARRSKHEVFATPNLADAVTESAGSDNQTSPTGSVF
jgi:hypothetical protein